MPLLGHVRGHVGVGGVQGSPLELQRLGPTQPHGAALTLPKVLAGWLAATQAHLGTPGGTRLLRPRRGQAGLREAMGVSRLGTPAALGWVTHSSRPPSGPSPSVHAETHVCTRVHTHVHTRPHTSTHTHARTLMVCSTPTSTAQGDGAILRPHHFLPAQGPSLSVPLTGARMLCSQDHDPLPSTPWT